MENILTEEVQPEKKVMKNARYFLLRRGLMYYFIMILLFSIAMAFVLEEGKELPNHGWYRAGSQSEFIMPSIENHNENPTGFWNYFLEGPLNELRQNLSHPLSIALFQIIVIISFSRIFSYLMRQVGQPAVIGEILAGIFLGPSLLGTLFPEAWAATFPLSSIGNLHSISTIGLSLFMFIIGIELDISMLNRRIQTALFVSHASILVPFFLGVLLAYYLYSGFAQGGTTFLTFSLFMGVSMSITAFPVLARIIQERGLSKTSLGVMAITCAATDDITAWCILAVVIAIAKAGDISSAFLTLSLASIYVVLMLKMVKPMLLRLSKSMSTEAQVNRSFIALAIIILLSSAFVAEIIGIHALFGAFLAGVTMPQDAKIREALRNKIEDISLLLFLPIFFAYTGLRTQIGLLLSDGLWKVCALVIACAVTGKVFGTLIAARLMGQSWKNSFSLGALMNTRGLMELVVLNIGYDLGIITPAMFVVLVLMAIFTTLMTGPFLSLIERIWPEKPKAEYTGSVQNSPGTLATID
jgi:Kef-type K+ transport system membrane component KefB